MSFCYSSEKQRRIGQFADALAPMYHRAVNVVGDCCFAIFEERPGSPFQASVLDVATKAGVVTACRPTRIPDCHFDPKFEIDEQKDSWHEKGGQRKFIQFVYLKKHFEMDLPNSVLSPTDAQSLVHSSRGFYFLGERGNSERHADVIHQFSPLRKAYVHGDEHSAAVDIATIFFNIWRFPVDSRLFFSTFGGKYTWENAKPLQ